MQRLAQWDGVAAISRWAYPQEPDHYLRDIVLNSHTVRDFQRNVMIPIARIIARRTSEGFTCSGLEHLSSQPTLYISNHRDIVMDAFFLQMVLDDNQFETSQIVVGSNLMANSVMTDLAYANKMLPIGRGGTKRGFAEELLRMSKALHSALQPDVPEQGSSVWIAQRNGRTKDRHDHTDPAIIHMMNACGKIQDYRIVPLSITYEIEPNASYKAHYLWHKEHGTEPLVEDYMAQMVEGITQHKGRIHYAFLPPLDISDLLTLPSKEFFHAVAERIDQAIGSGRQQWPSSPQVRAQWEAMRFAVPPQELPYMDLFDPQA